MTSRKRSAAAKKAWRTRRRLYGKAGTVSSSRRKTGGRRSASSKIVRFPGRGRMRVYRDSRGRITKMTKVR